MTRARQAFSYLLLVPAALPLIYVGGIIYPYITPKTFLLQGSGILALALFTALALSGQPFFYERLRARAAWIPAVLLVVAYGTSFVGTDFYHSFWGLFDRGDGLLTLSVITAYFYLLLLSADHEFLERLAKVITVVAGIVASIAVLQWATTTIGEKAAFLPPITGRIGSTLGNAAFLAGYLGMTFFVTLVVLRDSNDLWRRICRVTAVLSLFAIVFAATRGTILALACAGVAALVFAARRGEEKVMRAARYGLLALVIIAGLFIAFRSELAQSSFEPIRRVASISLTDETVSSRLFVWSNLTKEALLRPFTGYGSEHIARLFDKFYDPSKILEQWFDRSHNAFLDYFVQYGVFGLALYLALIIAFARCALQLYRREEGGPANLGFLFSLLILTYAIQNFFVFDTPATLWLLYALFALLVVLVSEGEARPLFTKRISLAVSGAAFVAIALLVIPAVLTPLYANILLTRGYLFHLIDVNKANADFERGLALGTYADLEYGYQAYEMYTSHQATQLSGKERIDAYDYALALLTANFKKYPYDARTATYLGHVLDTAPPEVTVDNAFDEQVLSRAIALSPLRAQAWYMSANILLRTADALPQGDPQRQKQYKEAIRLLETYEQKEPTLPVAPYTLANLYYALGDTVNAKRWADYGYPLYTEPDSAVARPAVKYYIATGDWRRAVRFLSDLVAKNPLDYTVLYDLAKVTYLAGDPETAYRIVEKLRTVDPTIISTDKNFLTAIAEYEQSRK